MWSHIWVAYIEPIPNMCFLFKNPLKQRRKPKVNPPRAPVKVAISHNWWYLFGSYYHHRPRRPYKWGGSQNLGLKKRPPNRGDTHVTLNPLADFIRPYLIHKRSDQQVPHHSETLSPKPTTFLLKPTPNSAISKKSTLGPKKVKSPISFKRSPL